MTILLSHQNVKAVVGGTVSPQIVLERQKQQAVKAVGGGTVSPQMILERQKQR